MCPRATERTSEPACGAVTPQAPKTVRNALHTRTNCSTNLSLPDATATFEESSERQDPAPMRSGSPTSTFDIGSLDLVREFVEHVVTKNALAGSMDHSSRHAIDWDALEASIANSSTLEQAIGRGDRHRRPNGSRCVPRRSSRRGPDVAREGRPLLLLQHGRRCPRFRRRKPLPIENGAEGRQGLREPTDDGGLVRIVTPMPFLAHRCP